MGFEVRKKGFTLIELLVMDPWNGRRSILTIALKAMVLRQRITDTPSWVIRSICSIKDLAY
jgi:hypothetical protein